MLQRAAVELEKNTGNGECQQRRVQNVSAHVSRTLGLGVIISSVLSCCVYTVCTPFEEHNGTKFLDGLLLFLFLGLMNMRPGRWQHDVTQAGRQKEEDAGNRRQVEGKLITHSFNVALNVNLSSQEVKPQGADGPEALLWVPEYTRRSHSLEIFIYR